MFPQIVLANSLIDSAATPSNTILSLRIPPNDFSLTHRSFDRSSAYVFSYYNTTKIKRHPYCRKGASHLAILLLKSYVILQRYLRFCLERRSLLQLSCLLIMPELLRLILQSQVQLLFHILLEQQLLLLTYRSPEHRSRL